MVKFAHTPIPFDYPKNGISAHKTNDYNWQSSFYFCAENR